MLVIYLTLKYLLSMDYVSCIVLAVGQTAVNKTDQVLVLNVAYILQRERNKINKDLKIRYYFLS